jgi:hypothetical protein
MCPAQPHWVQYLGGYGGGRDDDHRPGIERFRQLLGVFSAAAFYGGNRGNSVLPWFTSSVRPK